MISTIPEIAALQAEVEPGHCCFCEDRIPPRKNGKAIHCGQLECERSYHRIFRRERSRRFWAKGITTTGVPLDRAGPHAGKHRPSAETSP